MVVGNIKGNVVSELNNMLAVSFRKALLPETKESWSPTTSQDAKRKEWMCQYCTGPSIAKLKEINSAKVVETVPGRDTDV